MFRVVGGGGVWGVLWLPSAAETKGRQNWQKNKTNILSEEKNVTFLKQRNVNSINNCDFFF